MKNMFESWIIDGYYIQSPDGRHKLWVANGFTFFEDKGAEPLISGLNLYDKWLIWREYKKELRRRSKRAIREFREKSKQNIKELEGEHNEEKTVQQRRRIRW